VISRAIFEAAIMVPVESLIGDMVTETGNSSPVFFAGWFGNGPQCGHFEFH
jgi:hypothetical protein